MKLIVSALCSLMLLMGSIVSHAESGQGNSAVSPPPEQMEKPHNMQDGKHSTDGASKGSEQDIQKLKKKSETDSKANKSRDMQKESSGGSY